MEAIRRLSPAAGNGYMGGTAAVKSRPPGASMVASPVELRSASSRPVEPVTLRVEHLPQALELSRSLQWPYRIEDWAFAHELGRGVAVEIDGRLVGTALWWPYGEHHASAGMIIVAADAQRKGIGGALMSALLVEAKGRTVTLNSTCDGLALYTRLGFMATGYVHQHQAVLAKAPPAKGREATRAFHKADLPAIHGLDRAASGMERQALIEGLFAIGDVIVVEREGRVSGYGCVRTWGRGVVIGPVVAANSAEACALIAALAAPYVGHFVRIDVTAASGLSPWLGAVGLPQVNRVVAMALGPPPERGADATLFALANQSLG